MGELCSPDLLDVTVVKWPSLEGSTSSCFLISGAETLPVASPSSWQKLDLLALSLVTVTSRRVGTAGGGGSGGGGGGG